MIVSVDFWFNLQNAGSVPRGESDCPLQLLPEPFQTLETYNDSLENAGAIAHGPDDNAMHDPEVYSCPFHFT